MASFNKVIIMGNLTRDPELRFTPKGSAICKVGMAVNRVWTTEAWEKKEEVTFIDIDIFGRTAENVGQYMRKGSSMMVEGRLKLDQWDDKATGHKRSKLGVVAESVQFLGGKSEGESGRQEPRPARQSAAPPIPVEGDGPPESFDVPF